MEESDNNNFNTNFGEGQTLPGILEFRAEKNKENFSNNNYADEQNNTGAIRPSENWQKENGHPPYNTKDKIDTVAQSRNDKFIIEKSSFVGEIGPNRSNISHESNSGPKNPDPNGSQKKLYYFTQGCDNRTIENLNNELLQAGELGRKICDFENIYNKSNQIPKGLFGVNEFDIRQNNLAGTAGLDFANALENQNLAGNIFGVHRDSNPVSNRRASFGTDTGHPHN